MAVKLTKENYRELVWTEENISHDDYFAFYKTLEDEEKIDFLKFLISEYPDYDEDWIHGFFDIVDKWTSEGKWEKRCDFSDYLRENCPNVYKKEFSYISTHEAMSAYYQGKTELGNARFAESLNQPEKAIDDSLRAIFNLTSTDQSLVEVSISAAKKVWQPLKDSKNLIGGAEFDYGAFLYCELMKDAFDKIQKGEGNDWKAFEKKVVAIEFKMVEEFKLLPDFEPEIDWERFHKNADYSTGKLNEIFVNFLYHAHTQSGIPLYWAFRAWFNILRYLLFDEDSRKRSNVFHFSPKMVDSMYGSLVGFLGGNKDEAFISLYLIPYVYDFFLQQNFIDTETFTRLMYVYEASHRSAIKSTGNKFWKYYGLYSWKKPGYMSEEQFSREKTLLENSYGQSHEEFETALKEFFLSSEKLPQAAFQSNVKLSGVQKAMIKPNKPAYEKIARPARKNFGKKKKKKKKKR